MVYKDFMLDLETMGLEPKAAILSIGIVPMNLAARKIGEGFYTRVNLESCQKLGMNIDANTVLWWLQESQEARDEFKANYAHTHITTALAAVSRFISKQAGDTMMDQIRVWGNGSMMDNALLRAAYDMADKPIPWLYSGDMCFRTLRALAPNVERVKPEIAHHALSDAEAQAKTLFAILDETGLTL
ncbi:3'-5' exoribonuclease [Pseudoalteromonas sp. SCSIO 43088]|uniref:3'-5' exonuclease n=1 Tax=Pseudoalteromonas sp. SCSIO 43088 TaxID=2822846 RepID=UPI00202B04F6|nr:3'-5' exonuclease [Pseudoalteromonas sp. SCSIO 43088]URQ88230.1 3'-5' exoribonuclease [Pseudoalteromonas sp. SCSIO 43088]